MCCQQINQAIKARPKSGRGGLSPQKDAYCGPEIPRRGKMIQFDKEMAKKRLEALGYPAMAVDLELSAISNIHESLQEVFDAWIGGVEKEFEFKGISLDQIKQKENCDHLNAMHTMSMLIRKPEIIELFLSVSPEAFRRQCGGSVMGTA
jgi:hypothetical protein